MLSRCFEGASKGCGLNQGFDAASPRSAAAIPPPRAGSREFGKSRGDELASHVGEGVAVKEEERGAAMTVPQKLYHFFEGENLALLFFPLAAARCLSLAIKAVLRASSCARASVEVDDKLPTPVFEKSGSGL